MKTIEKESVNTITFSNPQQEILYNEIIDRIKEMKNQLKKACN